MAALVAALVIVLLSAVDAITVDGVLDDDYGAPLTTQTVKSTWSPTNVLAAAYMAIDSTRLYFFLAGNLETNGNRILLFFNASSRFSGLSAWPDQPRITFDTGFGPRWLANIQLNDASLSVNVVAKYGSSTFESAGAAAFDKVAQKSAVAGSVFVSLEGVSSATVSFALDNNNRVNIGSQSENTPNEAVSSNGSAVTRGLEIAVTRSSLTDGTVSATALICNAAMTEFSNQVLGGYAVGDTITKTTVPNFATAAGAQFFTMPAMTSAASTTRAATTTATRVSSAATTMTTTRGTTRAVTTSARTTRTATTSAALTLPPAGTIESSTAATNDSLAVDSATSGVIPATAQSTPGFDAAIIGAIVGGIVGLLLLLIGVGVCIARKRRPDASREHSDNAVSMQPAIYGSVTELMAPATQHDLVPPTHTTQQQSSHYESANSPLTL